MFLVSSVKEIHDDEMTESYILHTDNRFDCSCKEFSWLVLMPNPYKRLIEGFSCTNLQPEKRLQDLRLRDLDCY